MSILQRFTLDGSVAVITGAGRGIGRAIALAYAENGADVVCAARTLADVEAVADEVRALGRRAIAVSCDVTDLAQREALVASAREQFGRITHLVNNAGGAGPNDPLSWPRSAWRKSAFQRHLGLPPHPAVRAAHARGRRR